MTWKNTYWKLVAIFFLLVFTLPATTSLANVRNDFAVMAAMALPFVSLFLAAIGVLNIMDSFNKKETN